MFIKKNRLYFIFLSLFLFCYHIVQAQNLEFLSSFEANKLYTRSYAGYNLSEGYLTSFKGSQFHFSLHKNLDGNYDFVSAKIVDLKTVNKTSQDLENILQIPIEDPANLNVSNIVNNSSHVYLFVTSGKSPLESFRHLLRSRDGINWEKVSLPSNMGQYYFSDNMYATDDFVLIYDSEKHEYYYSRDCAYSWNKLPDFQYAGYEGSHAVTNGRLFSIDKRSGNVVVTMSKSGSYFVPQRLPEFNSVLTSYTKLKAFSSQSYLLLEVKNDNSTYSGAEYWLSNDDGHIWHKLRIKHLGEITQFTYSNGVFKILTADKQYNWAGQLVSMDANYYELTENDLYTYDTPFSTHIFENAAVSLLDSYYNIFTLYNLSEVWDKAIDGVYFVRLFR